MLSYRRKLFISSTLLFSIFILLFCGAVDTVVVSFFQEDARIPRQELLMMMKKCNMRIFTLGCGLFVFYIVLLWIVLRYFTRPLEQILDLIISYHEDKPLSPMAVTLSMQEGEFGTLAAFFHALTMRIQKQIERLKQQRKETEEILQSLGEGVIAMGTGGSITFANQAACHMLGVSLERLIGHSLAKVCAQHPELVVKCHELLQQALQTSETVEQTWSCTLPEQTYFNVTATPRSGAQRGVLVIQDKTSDYKVVEMGKNFIANASHELRMPITVIKGFAEILHDHPNLPQQRLSDIAEKILRTSCRLDQLVKSLLTLVDVDNVAVEKFQVVDLVSVAEQCKHMLLLSNPKAQIVLNAELDRIPVLADPLLLDLAITNLLENAVRYSPSPASIEVLIRLMGNKVELAVQDAGIGIPETDLPHIFERFYTVDKARSRKSGGTGLGLSIVKTIIEKHQGVVLAQSELGKGSIFTIVLPVKS